MNPQYMPQQGVPPQTFPQNRPSPSLTPQSSFQNVPLGPPKPMFQNNGPVPPSFAPPPNNMNMPYSRNNSSQNAGPPLSNNYPAPTFRPPTTNLNAPPTSIGAPAMNAPTMNMGLSSTSLVSPPSTTMGMAPIANMALPSMPNMAPPMSVANIGLPPTSNIAHPSSMNSINASALGPPPAANKPNVQNSSNVETSSTSGVQLNHGPPSQVTAVPTSAPLQTIPVNQLPPMPTGQKLSQQQQQQPNNGSQVMQDDLAVQSSNESESLNMKTSVVNGPNSNQPPQLKQQQQQQVPPLMSAGQYPYNQSGIMTNAPATGRPPLNQFPPQQQHQQQQQPLSMPPNQFNQPFNPAQSSLPAQPPNPMFAPGQNVPLMQSGQPPIFKPPPFGGNQMPPGVPPLAGQPIQYNHPPMPPSAAHLTNQMQNVSLSGPRQYPGMPQKSQPDLMASPQGYLNNQQMRMPQGYPPTPGQMPQQQQQQQQPGGFQQPYQQPPQRRLDPDQMPNPIQVTQDDQTTRSGLFCTNQKGLVPPLVTTQFVVQDQGNASPRYMRSSMYNVPISQDLMKQTAVPFGLVISPMARTVDGEHPPPIVNFGTLGPVRCIRCKAYMSPFMQFIDSGRRFQCLFCKASTDVPSEYFQHLDHTGQRMDKYERPELILGTYEMVATEDYCRNNTLPKPPAIIFVIDVSYNNVKSGLVNLLCAEMKEIIQNLPLDQGHEKSNMRVGFITYNSTVHFYNIKGTLAAPQMLVVGDTQEMFMPLLDGFLCTPEESAAVIDQLMEQIPAMFGNTRETETVLLPAILAGLEALKASDCAGKLMVFHSTLPIAEAPGKLKNRDDRKLLGTDKERTVLTPQTQAYNQLGQDCVGAGCSVDLFVFNNAYIDIATIGQVARLTGGEVYKYTYFQADLDGDRLISDIITNISRPIAFDAIMRVRTSTGVRPTDFYGHFFMSNTTDMELAAIDCDKAVAVEVKHDDKLNEDDGVYVQVALLYTSCSGQRRLRIINLSLKTCSQMSDLYRSCDLDTIINFFGKQAVYKLLDNNPKAVKDGIVNRAAQMLANYRKNCASPSSAGQLILPECMKLLPLYVNCLLRSDAISGGSDMTLDDRSYVMQRVMTMDALTSVSYFYPRLIPLNDIKPEADGKVEVPAPIRCTIEKMNDQGVYILENGIHMFLWIGLGASQEFVQQVFGVPSAIQIDVDKAHIPELDNPLSIAVRSIIEEIRIQKHRCMRLTLVRQREKLEPVFKHFLVEDRGQDGSPSYVDFLCHMHKEIRTILS